MPPAISLSEILSRARVVPVVTIDDAADAVPLARALAAGGLSAFEVTLRTAAAAAAIEAISRGVPEVVVGAGTLLKAEDFAIAHRAGARFGVSPGLRRDLVEAARAFSDMPYLPGIMTPSELMAARAMGFTLLKFFPCEPAGGPAMLRQLHGPFPDVRFCPTGGLTQDSYAAYLAQPNVICVGGARMAPRDRIEAGDWAAIERLARAAAASPQDGPEPVKPAPQPAPSAAPARPRAPQSARRPARAAR